MMISRTVLIHLLKLIKSSVKQVNVGSPLLYEKYQYGRGKASRICLCDISLPKRKVFDLIFPGTFSVLCRVLFS